MAAVEAPAAGGSGTLFARLPIFAGDDFEDFGRKFKAYLYTLDPAFPRAFATNRPADEGDDRNAWDANAASIYARLVLVVKGTPAGVVQGYETGTPHP